MSEPPDGMLLPDCMPEPAAEAIPAAASPRKSRSTTSLITNLLAETTSAPALMLKTGVSRQRVDQILHGLMREGKISRVREPGSGRRYLWFRSDMDATSIVSSYRKPMQQGFVRVLSCLIADSLHSMPQITAHLELPYYEVVARVTQLTKMGLATAIRVVRPTLVSITPSGLAHPERDVAASKAPALDVTRSLGKRRAEFIEALGVLEEARTIDLTAALLTEGREPRHSLSGQMIHMLLRACIAERIDGTSGNLSRYRLTDAGGRMAAWIARTRPPPAREHLESKISAFKSRRAPMCRENIRKRILVSVPTAPEGAQSPAQARVLRALEAGPLPTALLRTHISDLAHHPASIHTMLRALAARGAIREAGFLGHAKLWMLPERAGR
jgi:DNA-binding MarR family transcriptional regulator